MKYLKNLALTGALLAAASLAFAQTASAPVISSTTSSAPDPVRTLATTDIADALRQGGYVIYFRHTATDFSKNDAAMKGYADCANQRLLSSLGRAQALEIGQRITALKLPLGEALASPMCRTLDTARLMLGRITPQNDIREGESSDYPGLKRLLARAVPAGANRWIVGHGTPFREVAGAPHLAEGEAAVIRPEGTRWTVVARILPNEWAQLK
jgi:phosphohistidine phosphatase SixA